MLNPGRIVGWLLQIGLVLMATESLIEVTVALARGGASAQQRGFLRLGELNRGLGLRR